ncbi:CDP-diacylglycerol--glycerol-3-phosphate 3-phosphatidyltransferase, mitochondrial [Cylas formicarius]|uniref:CDP-diacylglycerol--glycerol-3-phosphate 3-phosphatidyltransferase, mitochondrial n=1 Tax=Cylas formicarius TaxID=197179 RepID=UPI0029586854|nr:CDP-diacylglycerol--glycerol-3-phosphate 3-phosphatidyltransferase, mitochondrial [Cylas formicarius]
MFRRVFSTIELALQNQGENLSYQNPFGAKETTTFNWLANVAPCFPLKADSVQIILEPKHFYDTLIGLCKNATERISLVSLYLGTGELEKKFVDALLTNENFLKKRLVVDILLDFTRGSRFEPNSRTMLLPLLNKNDVTCNISLYHTPALRGALKKYLPNRYNELLGLQHMKLYIFDDTLVISGANLSNDYFTNRQDRYFIIKDRNLTDFYCGFINSVQKFSLKMDKHNNVSLCKDWNVSPYEGSKSKFVGQAKELIEDYLSHFQNNSCNKGKGYDTWVFPVFQMGQLGIEQDSMVTTAILSEADPKSVLKIATGYFNLTDQYMETLIENCKARCEILMAHPKANGFLGAKGLAGGIPFAYSLIAHEFQKQLRYRDQQSRIILLEYLKNGWTYHAKGLWYYPENSQMPCMTMIGSPNFGDRSVTKDLETQVVILTENKELREKLHRECERLYDHGILAQTHRKVPVWVHTFVTLFRSYF